MADKLTIHHLEASRSLKVLWLAEYLGVPYELVVYPRDPSSRYVQDRDRLVAVHPLGRSPVLTVDVANGEKLTVAESSAVMSYLLQHHARPGDVRPSDKTAAATDLNFWLAFGESSVLLHSIPFMYGLRGGVTTPDASGIFDKAAGRGLKVDVDYLEQELAKRKGTLHGDGQVGPADIAVQISMQLLRGTMSRVPATYWKALDLELGPETQAWIDRCTRDPAYRAALDKEIQAGGKVKRHEDWLNPLMGA
ncbi:unnamed protein product [Parajaminaea phylloscopi]